MIGLFGAIWGIAGFILLLIYTLFRLTPIAVESFSYPFMWFHWLVLIVNTALMAYYEGYRGFQKGFSPRVAARARYLRNHPTLLDVVLAPLFCMGYFHATKRRKIATIILTITIVVLIIIIRQFNQPWRGIIDVGVVVGLGWGLVSVVIFSIIAFTNPAFDVSPEVLD